MLAEFLARIKNHRKKDTVCLNVHIEADLLEAITLEAELARRSINSEINELIEKGLKEVRIERMVY